MKTLLNEWMPLLRRQSTFFIALGLTLVVFALIDFFLRIYVARDAELRKFLAPEVLSMPTLEKSDAVQSRLVGILPEPKPTSDTAEVKPRELALQGVFTTRNFQTAALVLLPQGDLPIERRNLSVGGEIDGWFVERITRNRVTLRKGSELKELVLFRGKTE
jgi:hypothetical protein